MSNFIRPPQVPLTRTELGHYGDSLRGGVYMRTWWGAWLMREVDIPHSLILQGRDIVEKRYVQAVNQVRHDALCWEICGISEGVMP